MIDMYGKRACELAMAKLFNLTDLIDRSTLNAFITGLSRNGLLEEVLELFTQLEEQGVPLNVISGTSMIARCSQHGKDKEALELLKRCRRQR